MVMFPKIVDSLFTKDIFFYIVLLALVAAAPAVFIYTWLAKLFPGIEIQTGEDFRRAGKDKRNKFWLIISLTILLTIISFLLRQI
jgi:phosphate/sulfate permease